MASDGLILYLAAPRGSLVEVLVSDVGRSDHNPDRCSLVDVDPVPDHTASAPARASRAKAGQRGLIDQAPDRPPGDKELHDDQNMQQQHAREHVSAAEEDLPAELTPTEWATIRQIAPDYTLARLKADLAKLAGRPSIYHPIGVIVAALRRGEPIWGREELRQRNAAIAAQHAPPTAESPLPPPKRPRPDRAPAAPPADVAQLAPHGALWDLLHLHCRDADLVDWLCEGFDLEVKAEATLLHCRSADHALVARDLRGLLIDALRDLSLPDALEILLARETGPAAADHAPRCEVEPPDAQPEAAPAAPVAEQPVPEATGDHVPAALPGPGDPELARVRPTWPSPAARSRPPAPPGGPPQPRRPRWNPWRAS